MSRFRLPQDVFPEHYSLNVLPVPSTRAEGGFETYSGRASIDVTFVNATNKVLLNAKKLNVTAASLVIKAGRGGGPDVVVSGASAFDEESSQLLIAFKEVVPSNTKARLDVEFTGVCGNDSTGLYQNNYSGGKRKGLATQLQATDARKFFPCFDEPAFKATFDMTVTVPSFYTVLFNTPLKVAEKVDEHTTRHVFHKTPIMSTYLLALFVGEVDFVGGKTKSGVDIKVWTPVGEKDVGSFPLSVAIKTIEFFEQYYGIQYPLAKLDMIGLDSFLYGGMENWGLITYSSGMFYITEKDAFVKRKRCAYVVAHECAHMWFGNLVTMQWWHDLWLNEGFATYAGWQAVRSIYPEWDVSSILFTDELCRALTEDAYVRTHAVEIDSSIEDADEISSLVDTITYSKGLACLILAADLCGEKAFQAGVGSYLREFAYKNACSQDLFRHLAKASGKDVGNIIGRWTSMVGFPLVTVSREGNQLLLSQKRFLASGKSVESEPWPVPIKLSWDSSGKAEHVMLQATERYELPLRALEAQYLLLNAGQMAMYRVKYSPGLWNDLLSNMDLLAPIDRLALLDNVLALAEAQLASASDFLQLVQILEKDTNPQVANVVLQRVARFCNIWRNAENGKLSKPVLQLLNRVAQSYVGAFGEEARLDQPPVADTVRNEALKLLAMDPASPYSKKFLAQLKDWTLYKDSPVFSNILLAAATSGNEEAFATVMRTADQLKADAAKYSQVLCCAAKTADHAKLAALLEPLNSGNMFSVWCAIEDKAFLWRYIRDNWAKLHQVSGGSANTFGRMVAHVFNGLSELSLIPEINEFFATIPTNQFNAISAYVEKSKEQILYNSAWVQADLVVVEAVLDSRKPKVRDVV